MRKRLKKDQENFLSISATVGIITLIVVALSQQMVGQPCDVATALLLPADADPFQPQNGQALWTNKTATGGDRILHFFHGLGGNADSWNLVAAHTAALGSFNYPPRKVVYMQPYSYIQNGSLFSMAMDVDSYLGSTARSVAINQQIDEMDNVVIAHSLGGAVALMLDSLYADTAVFEAKFGGIITLGSGFQGVVAATNLDPNGGDMARAFVIEACLRLSDPDIWAYNRLPNLRWFPNLDPFLRSAVDSACGLLGSVFIPFTLKRFIIPVIQEIKPSSPLIQALGQRTPGRPTLVVYGVEDEPVFWRIASSFYRGDSVGMALAVDPFSMDDDEALVTFANAEANRYEAIRLTALADANWHRWMAQGFNFQALWHLSSAAALERKAVAAWRAKHWYENANESYKQIIGARTLTSIQSDFWCRCRNEAGSDFPYTLTVVSQASDCVNADPYAACVVMPRWVMSVVEHDNDGLVLASSAGSLPGAIASIALPGTNHQQMRNSSVTRELFKRIFNGQVPGGAFFATATR